MALDPNFTTESFTIERSMSERFRRLHPKYGEFSRMVRQLIRDYVFKEEKKRQRKKSFPATV